MQLAKYSKYKDKVYTTVASSSETSSSSTNSSSSDRNLWGNDDTGKDMNGSMRIQGNIYIMGETTTEDENGEEIATSRGGEASSRAGDDPFPPSAEDGEGNLFLDGKIYSEGAETRGDIVSGGHLYFKSTHPDHKGEKVCVGDMLNELFNIVCPIGSIIAFNGGSTIPDNWAVCDGTNGTPDLSGRFIKGTTDRTEVGNVGGQTEIKITSTSLPSHSHDFKFVPADWFVMSSGYNLPTVNVSEDNSSGVTALGTGNLDTIGSISGVTDTAGDDVGSNDPINIEPPYYTLIYIMRVK